MGKNRLSKIMGLKTGRRTKRSPFSTDTELTLWTRRSNGSAPLPTQLNNESDPSLGEAEMNPVIRSDYADVNGIKLYHEVYGQGEPLVLIHGGLTTIGGMQGWGAALAAICPKMGGNLVEWQCFEDTRNKGDWRVEAGAMTDPGQDPCGAPGLDPLGLTLDLTPEGRGTGWYRKLEYRSQIAPRFPFAD